MPTIVELLTASSVRIDAPGVDVTIALSNDGHVRAQRAGGSLCSNQSASALHITTEPEGRLVARVSGSTATTRAGRNVVSTGGDLFIGGRETTGQSEVSTGLTIDVPPGTWVIVDRASDVRVACSPESIILADRRSSRR